MAKYITRQGTVVDLNDPFKGQLGRAPVPGLDENGNVVGRIQFGDQTLSVPVPRQNSMAPSPGGAPSPEIVPPKAPAKPRLKIGANGKLELDNQLILGQNVEEVEPDNQLILGQNVEEVGLPEASALSPDADQASKLEQIYSVGSGVNWGAGLVGLGEAIAGRNPTQAVAATLDRSNKAIEEPVNMQKELTQERARLTAIAKAEREAQELEQRQARERDPNSDESKVAQEIAAEMGYTGDLSVLTAERFQTFSPALQLKYEKAQRALENENKQKAAADEKERQRQFQAEQNALTRDNQRFIAGQNAAMMRATRDEQAEARRDERTSKQVEKLSERLEPYQATFGAVESVEQLLGAPLENFENKGGKLLKNGKPSDLPGANIPGFGRFSFYNGDARQLTAAISGIFNRELKTRSGAAVTTQELERLKTEFNTGKFNSEAELINGLKRYKKELNTAFKNILTGAPPAAVQEYESRGGVVGGPVNSSQGSAPAQGNRSIANSIDDL